MSDTRPDDVQVRAEALYESIGGDLCICQRADVSHWCEGCMRRIGLIMDELRAGVAAGAARPPTPAANPPNLSDAAEMLWVVLANVSGGNWKEQTAEWQEAAARWRDYYFQAVAASRPRPQEGQPLHCFLCQKPAGQPGPLLCDDDQVTAICGPCAVKAAKFLEPEPVAASRPRTEPLDVWARRLAHTTAELPESPVEFGDGVAGPTVIVNRRQRPDFFVEDDSPEPEVASRPRPQEGDERLEAAAAQLLIELAFLLPPGTNVKEHPIAAKLIEFTKAVRVASPPPQEGEMCCGEPVIRNADGTVTCRWLKETWTPRIGTRRQRPAFYAEDETAAAASPPPQERDK